MTAPLAGWTPPPAPDGRTNPAGRLVTLEPLAPGNARVLQAANTVDDTIWYWLPYGPFDSPAAYDPRLYALRDPAAGTPGGVMSHPRIPPAPCRDASDPAP